MGRFAAGDYDQSIEYCNMAIAASAEMVHALNAKFLLAYTHLLLEQVDEAEKILHDILAFTETHGYEYLGTAAQALAGMVSLARGHLAAGVDRIFERMAVFKTHGKQYHLMTFQYLLGKVFLRLALKQGGLRLRLIGRNLIFLMRHLPFAARKAEINFQKAVRMAESIGALGVAGEIHFDLARLYTARHQRVPALESIDRSIAHFQRCHADVHLAQARKFRKERLIGP
ncbi:MAG: hypothetical protein PVJ53_14425, partial [Desulfobacterales bacterium]|jgi:tetratricopeptide (TPR) repeat protein